MLKNEFRNTESKINRNWEKLSERKKNIYINKKKRKKKKIKKKI